VMVVPAAEAPRAVETLAGHGHRAMTIGEVVPGSGTVQMA